MFYISVLSLNLFVLTRIYFFVKFFLNSVMSADNSKSVVLKGVTYGAVDYLIKPVRIEALQNIWQHVVRKRRSVPEHSGGEDAADDNSSTVNGGKKWRSML